MLGWPNNPELTKGAGGVTKCPSASDTESHGALYSILPLSKILGCLSDWELGKGLNKGSRGVALAVDCSGAIVVSSGLGGGVNGDEVDCENIFGGLGLVGLRAGLMGADVPV